MIQELVVVIYFSRKDENLICGKIEDLSVGNTQILAKKIGEYVQAETLEICPVKQYPKNYHEMIAQAEKEKRENLRPNFLPLENSVDAEAIFLGFPNWCGSFPRVVARFLESYDFSQKTLYPFCTHEGSSFGSSLIELRQLCPDSLIMLGLPVRGSKVQGADRAVKNWLAQYQNNGGMENGKK